MNARREQNRKIQRAMTVIERFGQAEGDHHKAWVIDQVARELVGNHYPSWVYKSAWELHGEWLTQRVKKGQP